VIALTVDLYSRLRTQMMVEQALILNYFRAIDYDQWFTVPEVTVPTQFVWGAEDPYLADSTARSTAEHVKGSYRGVSLDRVGHWVPETAREQLTELVFEHILGREISIAFRGSDDVRRATWGGASRRRGL
jgi:pimeloyl-ACP methyl ester carboxylesterase